MAISFTVRAIEPGRLTVDYSDGTWAVVPLSKGLTKDEIITVIGRFNHYEEPFDSVEEVPFAVGETGTTLTAKEAEKESLLEARRSAGARLMDYRAMRANAYPEVGDQLDALFWSRNGDSTQLEALDAQITSIKEAYPKDMQPMPFSEYEKTITGS